MPLFLISIHVNLDHLVKVISVGFSSYKATIIFVTDKYLVGYVETMQISCFSSTFHLLILSFISEFCLQRLLLCFLSNGDFEF